MKRRKDKKEIFSNKYMKANSEIFNVSGKEKTHSSAAALPFGKPPAG